MRGICFVCARFSELQKLKPVMTDYIDFYNSKELSDGTTLQDWILSLEDSASTAVVHSLLMSPAARLCKLNVQELRSRPMPKTFVQRIYLFATLVLRRLGIDVAANGQVSDVAAQERQLEIHASYNQTERMETMQLAGRIVAGLFMIKAIRIAVAVTNKLLIKAMDLFVVQAMQANGAVALMLEITPAIEIFYNIGRSAFEPDGAPFDKHLDPTPVEWRYQGEFPYPFCKHGLLLVGPKRQCVLKVNLEQHAKACLGRR